MNTGNKRVIGYLAEELWTTFADLNDAIDRRVAEINEQMRRADGTTRDERFRAEEAELLQPLPTERFDTVAWKQLKVGRNYHVIADYQHYSVPYRLAGQILRVRLTTVTVTVFDGESVVCEHPRKVGRKGQYSTRAEHAPKQHQDIDGLWSRQWFVHRARSFGAATTAVIEMILDRSAIEGQAYLDSQNILMTLGNNNKQRLESACQQMINQQGYPTYTTLKRIMATITTGQSTDPATGPGGFEREERSRVCGPARRPGAWGRLLPGTWVIRGVFTSVDHEKFRSLRITHVAARFEELIKGEANDDATPEELFLTAVDEALELSRSSRIEKLVHKAGSGPAYWVETFPTG